MELKRFYEKKDGQLVLKDGKPVVSHVRVRRATKRWMPSSNVIEQGVAEGYFAVANGELSLKVAPGESPVTFKIVHGPGHYCCFCNKPLNDSAEGKAHVEQAHAGQVSPDQSNPSGWRRDNHYTLEGVQGDFKPERPIGQTLRYAAQQNARREAARAKIAANAAKAQ